MRCCDLLELVVVDEESEFAAAGGVERDDVEGVGVVGVGDVGDFDLQFYFACVQTGLKHWGSPSGSWGGVGVACGVVT
jgi:hypothetical protein